VAIMSDEITKAIEEGAQVEESTCICFCCAHSAVFIRAVPRPVMNQLTRKMEMKAEAKSQAICVRWAAPMLIGTDVDVQACTEFELGPVKNLKTPGDREPGISLQ